MKIKITDLIRNYDSKPLKDIDETGKVIEVTWRRIFITALNTLKTDEVMTAEVKDKCYQISSKIYASDEPDFTVSELAFIQERIDKIYLQPLVLGRVQDLFENNISPADNLKNA